MPTKERKEENILHHVKIISYEFGVLLLMLNSSLPTHPLLVFVSLLAIAELLPLMFRYLGSEKNRQVKEKENRSEF